MSGVDEHIERLIVRRLDGELSEPEAAELDRELLRSPEARRLLEEYQRIDAAAAEALAAACRPEAAPLPPVLPGGGRAAVRQRWLQWVVPLAAAAAVAMAVVLVAPRQGRVVPVAGPAEPPRQVARPVVRPQFTAHGDGGVYRGGLGGRDVDRTINQNLLFIVGQDGSVYVIDQQRIRTALQPDGAGGTRRVRGDL